MSFLDINDKVLLFLSARSGRLEEEGTLQISFCLHIWLEEMGIYEAQESIDQKDTLHVWKFSK